MQNGIPQRIANYDVERRLGRGNMGTVYLARDRDLGRHVAIKVIQADIDSADIRERFNREARSIAALNHPNIVTLYHAGQEESLPYLVLEHIDGRSVLHVISKREAVPLAQRLLWIEQLCEGLQYAHERGIIHRDIKPANLMIDHLNRLRILDFGIARIFGEARTQMSTLIGTPAYMAPEYIRGEGIDARADVFAAGAVAYELLSYQRAFAGDTQSTILHRVLSEMPAHFGDADGTSLDPEFEDVVFRALNKDPNSRFHSAREMADAIRSLRGRVDVSAEAWAKPGTSVATVAIETKDLTRESSVAGTGTVANAGTLTADPGVFAPTQLVDARSTTSLGPDAQLLARDEEPLPYEPTLLAGTTRSNTLATDTPGESADKPYAATTPPSRKWRYAAIAAGVIIIPAALVTGLVYFAEPTINTSGGTTTPSDGPPPPGPIVPSEPPAAANTGTGTVDVGKGVTSAGSTGNTVVVTTPGGNKSIAPDSGGKPDTGGKELEGVPVRTAYDLFNGNGGASLPGLIYRILQRANGGDSVVSVDPRDTVFRTGRDQFRFAFRSNMDGYLYVAQKSDQGDWDVVFPEPGVNGGSNRVQKNQEYVAPSPDWFQLDPPSGTETVFVFLSKKPVGAFNDLNRPVTSQATLAQSEIDKLTSTISMRKLVVAKGDVPSAASSTGGQGVYVVNADSFADAVMVTFDMTHK